MSLFINLASLTMAGMVMAAGSPPAPPQHQVYATMAQPKHHKITKITVIEGENLSQIASKYKTTWRRIFDANKRIEDPDVINPGDKLRIPDKKERLKHRALPSDALIASNNSAALSGGNYNPTAQRQPVPTGGVWDKLAACESGGNWSYNGASGFDGGLQFLPSTWSAYNKNYAFAWQAPSVVQIATAQRLLAAHSGSYRTSWPACSIKLGLP